MHDSLQWKKEIFKIFLKSLFNYKEKDQLEVLVKNAERVEEEVVVKIEKPKYIL